MPLPHGPKRPLLLLLVVLALGAALAGCGGSENATGDKGYVDGAGVITRLSHSERVPVDVGSVSGESLQGKQVALGDFAGKPVVVNVWASWCPPCRAETKDLTAAAKQLGDRVAFLGIDVRDPGGKAASLAFERRFQVGYPSLYDPTGRTLLAFRGKVSPFTIPTTLVIDRHGKIAARILGAVPSTQTLVDLVSDVEKETR